MMSGKVLLTYKRKRFSANANPANVVKADSSVKTVGEHCFRCGSVDINENLLVCHSCSGSYHLRCIDSSLKNVSEDRWLCPPCIERCDSEISIQHQSYQTGKTTENRSIGESETGAIKLHTQKVLSSSGPSEISSRNGSPSPVDPSMENIVNRASANDLGIESGSACRVVEETLRSQSTNLETVGRSSSLHLKTWTERNTSSRFSEDCASMVVSSDKRSGIILNDEYPKGNTKNFLITFRRRVKKKRDVVSSSTTRNSSAEDKHSSMVTSRSHELGNNCRCSDSTFLLEADGPSRLNALQEDMHDVNKDAGLGPKLSGQGTADKCEEPCQPKPDVAPQGTTSLQYSERVLQCQSDKCTGMPTSDLSKDPTHKSKQSEMAKTGTSIRGEEGNELFTKERGHVGGAELLVVPVVSTHLTSSNPTRPLVDAMAENFLESQRPSAQNCALGRMDEETDGRAKGLQWMETLDKSHQETTKETKSSILINKNSTNCTIASSGRASTAYPVNSSTKIQVNQDVSRECIDRASRLQERLLVTKSNNSIYEKQQRERASHNSMYTDFADQSLILNSEVLSVSMNDIRGMPLPLDLNFKDTVEGYNRQHRWDSMGENASVSRQKQVCENDMNGSRMPKESSLLDNFKRFSDEWSEEELDVLWIGVRRHGLNNWNDILRDPKLCFLKSRVAEDLALQWDKEQIKLLNGTLYHPERPSVLDLSRPLGTDDTCWRKATGRNLYCEKVVSSYLEFPTQRTETKLSLGDVYVQSEKNIKKNVVPNISGLSIANPHGIRNSMAGPFIGSNLIGSVNPRADIRHQNAFKTQGTRYDCESSTSPQKSVERGGHEQRSSANSTLPHWLKEVLTVPQRRSSLPLPSGVSSLNPGSIINYDERVTAFLSAVETALPKDPRGRGILKRKSKASSNHANRVKVLDNSVSVDDTLLQKRLSSLPNLGLTPLKPASANTGSGPSHVLDLNNKSPDPTGPSNLVVIDSDVSSEETISDDQSSRW
ncbi:uncharacterized protein LOC135581020 isoform X2 [Musa acuminata AAA Group]|uniref:uncharacterized protein LOC135581020 isoform X2 n=1 Tax=Musa acuminata AAA Group TaxID=214697 RepID=UPI0031DF3D8F